MVVHEALKADPLLGLWPILLAMVLVLLGNWLVRRHYEVNGMDAPTIMGDHFMDGCHLPTAA